MSGFQLLEAFQGAVETRPTLRRLVDVVPAGIGGAVGELANGFSNEPFVPFGIGQSFGWTGWPAEILELSQQNRTPINLLLGAELEDSDGRRQQPHAQLLVGTVFFDEVDEFGGSCRRATRIAIGAHDSELLGEVNCGRGNPGSKSK